MAIWHLDYETFSACDISLGAFRYASDPSTKVLMAAIAKDDGPVCMWDRKGPEAGGPGVDLFSEMLEDDGPIYAHNAQFEMAITKYALKTHVDVNRWRCTSAMCRRAAIPYSLGKAGEYLGLVEKKSTIGHKLIRLFSMPQKDGTIFHEYMLVSDGTKKVTIAGKKYTLEEAWETFKEYCIQDVVTERELHKTLAGFELKGFALEGFQFDLRMNDYGIPVNINALNEAIVICDEYNEELTARYKEITGLNPSQTVAGAEWFRDNGLDLPDLTAVTIEEWLKEPKPEIKPEVYEALEIRRKIAFTAIKKIPTMIEASCHDHRVRGGFMWSGALRTHRWSGQIIQPQNFKRPTIKRTDLAYGIIEDGMGLDVIKTLWDSPLEVVASCVRHFIKEPGREIIDADFKNIEARITPWLCNDPMLDEFRAGEDVYVTMAADIFSVNPEEVNQLQRFVGKQATLAAQFGVSWKKFQRMCALYGRELSDEVCKLAIYKYRKKRTEIVKAWREYQDAAVSAIENPGTKHPVRDKVTFFYGSFGKFAALAMRLPSGHVLMYPDAKLQPVTIKADILKEDEHGKIITEPTEFESKQILYYGPLPEKTIWGMTGTHGSKLLENATQAVGGDFMSHGLIEAEKQGFKIFATIHDQALATYEPELAGCTPRRFKEALCSTPKWATDFPLEASVGVTPYYTKDD